MNTERIMALADAYAQEAKDFGHLDNSTNRAALQSAVDSLLGCSTEGNEMTPTLTTLRAARSSHARQVRIPTRQHLSGSA